MTHDLTFLKECWLIEVTNNKKVSTYRLFKSFMKSQYPQKRYLFWWRLANEMHMYGNHKQRGVAKHIQKMLITKFAIEIELGAKIGKNLKIGHPYAITISRHSVIGENCFILQNATVGGANKPIEIKIGDNVDIGAGSIILGGKITIGNNVKIGAMSFVNKDIPDNCTVYTQKTNTIIQNN